MSKLDNEQLKKLYDKYIARGWCSVNQIQQEFNIKREEIYKTVLKAGKLYGNKKKA